jgi:hypothetical protein
MSFSNIISDDIQKILNQHIDTYINVVSSKFNIDKKELNNLWNNKAKDLVQTKLSFNKEPESPIKEPSESDNLRDKMKVNLLKLNKAELVEMCKTKKLKVTGTKNDLIELICNFDLKGQTDTQKKSQSPPKKLSPAIKDQKVIKKLVEKIPSITIKRNQFDNYEHAESKLVFNNKTQKVYGKQNPDGSISDLTDEDINLCNKYKFQYIIPDNLDKKLDLKNIEIDELNDFEDLEEELEDEIENEDEEEEEDGEEEFEDEYFDE